MLNKIKRWRKIAFISILITNYISAFEVNTLTQAVNIAGKQRMYTQKMLNDYGMIGLGLKFSNPKEELQNTMKEFEEHLEALDKFNKDPKIKKALNKERDLYSKIKIMLKSPPKIEDAIKLQQKLDELMGVADKVTNMFAAKTGKKSGKIINIAGRQRMLSQRIAGLYMLKAWGVRDKEFQHKMKEAMKLFEDSLSTLMKSTLNKKEIVDLLKKVKSDYTFFKIMNRSSTKFIPALIYRKSNEILYNMDRVTELYTSEKIQ